jgi:peroxiredoxin
MPGPISIGDEAPNFDLSSTEECLLMLKDEVVRTALVLYFFADPASERVLRDLDTLNAQLAGLVKLQVRVLAVSPVPLDDLKKLQRERKLLFPLLHDDRNFAAAYGIAASAEGEEGQPYAPAMVVVDRRQRVRLYSSPVASVADSFSQVESALKAMPSPTKSYPKSVINSLIDRWVN